LGIVCFTGQMPQPTVSKHCNYDSVTKALTNKVANILNAENIETYLKVIHFFCAKAFKF